MDDSCCGDFLYKSKTGTLVAASTHEDSELPACRGKRNGAAYVSPLGGLAPLFRSVLSLSRLAQCKRFHSEKRRGAVPSVPVLFLESRALARRWPRGIHLVTGPTRQPEVTCQGRNGRAETC